MTIRAPGQRTRRAAELFYVGHIIFCFCELFFFCEVSRRKERGLGIRTQLMEGSSQSDVTVEDVESLSREPKRSKTVHVVGHCQKL